MTTIDTGSPWPVAKNEGAQMYKHEVPQAPAEPSLRERIENWARRMQEEAAAQMVAVDAARALKDATARTVLATADLGKLVDALTSKRCFYINGEMIEVKWNQYDNTRPVIRTIVVEKL